MVYVQLYMYVLHTLVYEEARSCLHMCTPFTLSARLYLQHESGPSFDIPEDYREASSFNTLEKKNRVNRSPSPPVEGGDVYAAERLESGYTNPQATSYEVMGSSGDDIDGYDDHLAGEIPHYSNTVV